MGIACSLNHHLLVKSGRSIALHVSYCVLTCLCLLLNLLIHVNVACVVTTLRLVYIEST